MLPRVVCAYVLLAFSGWTKGGATSQAARSMSLVVEDEMMRRLKANTETNSLVEERPRGMAGKKAVAVDKRQPLTCRVMSFAKKHKLGIGIGSGCTLALGLISMGLVFLLSENKEIKFLRMASIENILSQGVHELLIKLDGNLGAIDENYLPLFEARSPAVRPRRPDGCIADELIRYYPELPEISNADADAVKRIIREIVEDRNIDGLMSHIMSGAPGVLATVLKRTGPREARQSEDALENAARRSGSLVTGTCAAELSWAGSDYIWGVAKHINQLLTCMIKAEIRGKYSSHTFMGQQEVISGLLGTMQAFYRSDLDFGDAKNRENPGLLTQRESVNARKTTE